MPEGYGTRLERPPRLFSLLLELDAARKERVGERVRMSQNEKEKRGCHGLGVGRSSEQGEQDAESVDRLRRRQRPFSEVRGEGRIKRDSR